MYRNKVLFVSLKIFSLINVQHVSYLNYQVRSNSRRLDCYDFILMTIEHNLSNYQSEQNNKITQIISRKSLFCHSPSRFSSNSNRIFQILLNFHSSKLLFYSFHKKKLITLPGTPIGYFNSNIM